MNLTQLIQQIRWYTNVFDTSTHPDSIITTWIRMGEQRVEQDLRVDDMITIVELGGQVANLLDGLPDDWIETDFIRKSDGIPLAYLDRFEFFAKGMPAGHFTNSGNNTYIGGKPSVENPVDIELHYFAQVPDVGASSTWLTTKHLPLIVSASLIPAFVHMEELDKAATHEANVEGIITRLNEARIQSRTVRGARLKRRVKGFG